MGQHTPGTDPARPAYGQGETPPGAGVPADGDGTRDDPRPARHPREQRPEETPTGSPEVVGLTGLPPEEEAELFRSISVSSPDGVVAADPDGLVVWANDAAGAVFGWSPAELVGRPLTVMLAPEVHDQAFELRRRVLDGEDIGPLTTIGRRRDGSAFPLSLATAVRRNAGGRVLGISAIARDLTHEHRVQRDLTEALARSHARFDQVAKPQALLDLEARFVAVNDAACRMLGWRRDQLLGRDARELVMPVDPASANLRLERITSGETDAVSYDAVAVRPDRSEVPLLVDVSLVRDLDGTPRELAVFARDLSDVAEARQRVQEQDAFFRAVYRRATDPAFVLDADGQVLYASPAFTRVFGLPGADPRQRSAFDFLHADDASRVQRLLDRLADAPARTERVTVRGRDVTGRWRWFDAVATNCLDDPSIAGVVVNLRETTAEIVAREELRVSEERYRAIVETAQEGIIALDEQGVVLFANEKMADILGLDQESLVGRRRSADRLAGGPGRAWGAAAGSTCCWPPSVGGSTRGSASAGRPVPSTWRCATTTPTGPAGSCPSRPDRCRTTAAGRWAFSAWSPTSHSSARRRPSCATRRCTTR